MSSAPASSNLRPALARLIVILYFALLILVAVGIVYLGTSYGLPLWVMIGVALLVIHILNASLLFLARSVKLRADGKQPPSYFKFMLESFSFRFGDMQRSVRSPLWVRIILALVVLLAALLLLAGAVSTAFDERDLPVIVTVILLCLGILSLWLTWRFLK